MRYLAVALLVSLAPATAFGAEVLVLSNSSADVVVDDFAINTSHNLSAWDANQTPTLDELQQYEVILLFEDGVFANAVNIGNVLAEHYENGGRIVTATFYLQDRSDAGFGGSWGALEQYDPFTGEAGGCEYGPDSMDVTTIVDHPITSGVNSLSAASYRGGATAKPDTTVLALWSTPNPNGLPDPVVGFRQDADTCIVGITVIPHAANFNGEVTGDFHTLFDNALTWASTCAAPGPCHNGVLDDGEACDDGNFQNGDACVGQCLLASCGDGYVQLGVEPCDDGDDPNTDDECLPGCIAASCGDGFIQAGVEGCDDANDDDTDTCVGTTCQLASCGDGFVFAGFEGCDDGNDVAGDGCTGCQLDSSESSSEGGESTGVAESSEGSSSTSGGSMSTTDSGETGSESEGGSSSGGEGPMTPTGASDTADDSGSSGASATSAASFNPGEESTGESTAGMDTADVGCGCTTDDAPRGSWMLLSLGLLGLRSRRRRGHPTDTPTL